MSTKPLLALLLAPLLFAPMVYAGVPGVPSPTCVKWCGNETSGSKSSAKQSSKHHSSPMPDIDVGAMMDAAKARKNKARQADMAAAKAAESVRLQQEAKKRESAAKDQAAFKNDMQGFGTQLKEVSIEAPNNITLKPVPPARSARSQLDCVANIKPDPNNLDAGAGNWESASGGCKPITPVVPEPPPPTRVEDQAAQPAKMLDDLIKQITTKREVLTQLDQEVASREKEVAQESLKIVSPEKGESDAMRRAREALEKARADRARTADELAKLEQQEQQAREQHRSGP